VTELFANAAGDRSMRAMSAIGRQVEAARKALGPRGETTYQRIAGEVGTYYRALEAAGVADHDVETTGAPPRTRKRTRAKLALALPLAIPGAVLWWLPYQAPRFVAARLAKGERDVVSTYKLATGLVAMPLWAAILLGAAFVAFSWPWAIAASVVAVASPFAALVWLDWLERPRAKRGASAREGIPELRARRAALMAMLEQTRSALVAS
jgi:hypothetical protein